MKALVATLVLFALLVGAVIANSIYVDSVCSKIKKSADELKSATQKEQLISSLKALWKKSKPILSLSIRANEIERMNDFIESLEASHNAQNDAEFQKYCTLISALAEEFASYERISANSIG